MGVVAFSAPVEQAAAPSLRETNGPRHASRTIARRHRLAAPILDGGRLRAERLKNNGVPPPPLGSAKGRLGIRPAGGAEGLSWPWLHTGIPLDDSRCRSCWSPFLAVPAPSTLSCSLVAPSKRARALRCRRHCGAAEQRWPARRRVKTKTGTRRGALFGAGRHLARRALPARGGALLRDAGRCITCRHREKPVRTATGAVSTCAGFLRARVYFATSTARL